MTQKPKEHDVGVKALKAVSKVISSADHKPHEVVNDYGEDLLVHTSREGQIDASRLWFQVKGTAKIKRHRLKRGGFKLSITFDHAMRWIRTLDLVVVVLWDVVERVGWYAIPRDQVDAFEVTNSGLRTVTLRFSPTDDLTKEAVDRLAWRSRLEHQRLLVLGAKYADQDQSGVPEITSPERRLTALDLTDLLGMTERRLDPDGLRYRLKDEVWNEFLSLSRSLPKRSEIGVEDLLEVVLETVVRRWEMVEPALKLPEALIEEGAEFILDKLEEEAGARAMLEAEEA